MSEQKIRGLVNQVGLVGIFVGISGTLLLLGLMGLLKL
jgi:hypothetical protein